MRSGLEVEGGIGKVGIAADGSQEPVWKEGEDGRGGLGCEGAVGCLDDVFDDDVKVLPGKGREGMAESGIGEREEVLKPELVAVACSVHVTSHRKEIASG